MSKTSVLVVDDEKDLVELVRYNLERAGYDVMTAADGAAAFDVAFRKQPNLIVLDVMMPGMDGLEVCRRLRNDSRTSTVPIIMLTAKAAETDRVVGLELGADDYVIKPFSPRELTARVKALLRRSNPQPTNSEVLRCGKLMVDCSRREVRFGGERVSVTATEFRILEFMLRRPGRVLSRNDIIDGALGHDVIVSDRTIDVHMTALRRKLGDGGQQIETVRGFGYRLSDEAREAATE